MTLGRRVCVFSPASTASKLHLKMKHLGHPPQEVKKKAQCSFNKKKKRFITADVS